VSAAALDLQAWLDLRCREVNAALDARLTASAAPAVILEAMRYPLVGGGKRLRPLLAIAAAEAVLERHGNTLEAASPLALPAACAVEMIHTYSLVHDDLPAMDNDTLRRGRPTAHVVFGEGLAILAGDGLLTEAFALLAREPGRVPGVPADTLARRKLQAIAVIAEAAGAPGMVGGQAIDLEAAAAGAAPLDPQGLRDMHARKTGALIRASVASGAVMAGAEDAELHAAADYATQIGLAFQIVDDILDVEGASADLGKTAGKDAAAGKPTYPAFFGVEPSRRLAAECLDRALDALRQAGLGGQLAAIGHWVVRRRQ
jgi:geranylgeranyl diphosphate synthase, type II